MWDHFCLVMWFFVPLAMLHLGILDVSSLPRVTIYIEKPP